MHMYSVLGLGPFCMNYFLNAVIISINILFYISFEFHLYFCKKYRTVPGGL